MNFAPYLTTQINIIYPSIPVITRSFGVIERFQTIPTILICPVAKTDIKQIAYGVPIWRNWYDIIYIESNDLVHSNISNANSFVETMIKEFYPLPRNLYNAGGALMSFVGNTPDYVTRKLPQQYNYTPVRIGFEQSPVSV